MSKQSMEERMLEVLKKYESRWKKKIKNAVPGQVVTRFPPEPNGYLHIGHVRAIIVDYYYPKIMGGHMIFRFDDTNPKKEKQEFIDCIKEDLETLGIKYSKLTHTSDHFETILDYATKLIESGLAYCDDTDQKQVREERMKGIASRNRDASVE